MIPYGAPAGWCVARVYQYTLLVASISGLLGALYMIVAHFRLSERRRAQEGQLVLFWLSVADFWHAASYAGISVALFASDASQPGCPSDVAVSAGSCALLGGIMEYFSVAAIFWTAALAVLVNEAIDCAKRGGVVVTTSRLVRHRWKVAHAICWLVPAVMVSVLAAIGAFGSTGDICWIKPEHRLGRFFGYFGLLLLLLALFGATYIRHRRRLAAMCANEPMLLAEEKREDYVGQRLFRLLLAFGVIGAVQFTNRLWNVFNGDESFFLGLVSNAISPLQGLADAIIWSHQPAKRRAARRPNATEAAPPRACNAAAY